MADSGRRTVTERNHLECAAITITQIGGLLLTPDRLMLFTVRRPLLTDHR